MSDWKEVIEDECTYFVHDELGSVVKLADGIYVSMMPKVIRLGPFETEEQAKQSLEQNRKAIDEVLDNFNHNLVDLMKMTKEN
jgi:hypothetical protein